MNTLKTLSIALISCSLFSSCVTYEKCAEKFGSDQTRPILNVNMQMTLPKDSSKVRFSAGQMQTMPINGSLSSTSSSGLTSSLNRLSETDFECEAKTETKVVEKLVPVECPPVTHFTPDPIIIYKTPFWNWLLIAVFGLLAVFLYLRTVLTRLADSMDFEPRY